MFSISLTGDLGKKYKLAVVNVEHLDGALKQFSKYLREKTKERFSAEGPGWPKLADSTDHRLHHSFTGKFTVTGKIRKSAKKNILRQIEVGIKKGKIPASARTLFKQISAGNLTSNPVALQAFGFFERKKKAKEMNAAEKIQSKLIKLAGKSREARADALKGTRAIGRHKMLGKLANTIKSKIVGNVLTVGSSVEWAKVHDNGGAAGKGAQIPQREFMKLDDQDIAVLATLLEAQMVENIE